MTIEQMINSFGSNSLDWNLIALYGVYATVFILYEWVDSDSRKEFKLTVIKFLGMLIGAISFHLIVHNIFQLKENPTANALLSGTLIYLINFVFVNMVKDARIWKGIKRELMKTSLDGSKMSSTDDLAVSGKNTQEKKNDAVEAKIEAKENNNQQDDKDIVIKG